ncbi:MAG: hypothetical protein AT714_04625 [Vulcanisaeta sp. OSP_8]|nr:MAG: hypothetical protein AT714_04625 [Vulcanisaeta sp. OSP_8]
MESQPRVLDKGVLVEHEELSKNMDWRKHEGESNPLVPHEIVKHIHAVLKTLKASLEQSPAMPARAKPMNPARGANEGWAREKAGALKTIPNT